LSENADIIRLLALVHALNYRPSRPVRLDALGVNRVMITPKPGEVGVINKLTEEL
jgi:hypothetical protein